MREQAQTSWFGQWMDSFGHCLNWIWNRKAIRRARKINGAIAQCEAAKLNLEKKQDVVSLKIDQYRVETRMLMLQGKKSAAKQKLRQQKQNEKKKEQILLQINEMDRKTTLLSDLLLDSDVTRVIQAVAGAMETLDVEQQLSDLDEADQVIAETITDAAELSQRLEDSARLNLDVLIDDVALEAELAGLLGGGPPADKPGTALPAFPSVPTGTLESVRITDVPYRETLEVVGCSRDVV